MLSPGGNSEVNRLDRTDGQDRTLDMRQYLRRLETPLSAHHTVAGCDGPGDCVCVNPKQREVKTHTGHRTHLAMRPCPDSENNVPRD
jgi:hypothetical protein